MAIFDEHIKNFLLGPRLKLSLLDPQGDLTARANGTPVQYFHIKVVNLRPRTAAKSVQVRLQRIWRNAPGGGFLPEPVVYPLPLAWTPMELQELRRDVFDESTCDFGSLDRGATEFCPSTLVTPNNFRGRVKANDCVRFEIRATGPNVYLSKPLYLQVAWDGKWAHKREEIQKHLSIEEKSSLDTQ